MSDEVKGLLGAQEEMMRRLKSIGADLWRGAPGAENRDAGETGEAGDTEAMTSDIEEAWRRELGASPTAGRLKAAEKPAREKAPAKAPEAKRTIENLWITADETVDWTEALLKETPGDGLTGMKAWSFYHRMAGRVLEGDVDAYAEVLTTVNPLGDLTEYVSGMVLRTPGPERLECVFECQRDYLEKHGRDYLSALSLRAARDLLAILPVSEVKVSGNLDGAEKISVTFRREQLLKRKMAFVKPAEFTEQCGGIISL